MLRNPSKLLKNQWKLLTSSQSFIASIAPTPTSTSYSPRTFSSSCIPAYSPRSDSSHQQQSGTSHSQESSSGSPLSLFGILPFAMLFFVDHLMNKKAKNCGIVGQILRSPFSLSPPLSHRRCGWIRECQ
jgi:hypothetical protein